MSFPEQWNADHIQANSITTDRLTVGIHPNLLKSKYTDFQSFANNGDIGSGVGNGTAKCDTGNFYIGDRCLEMIASATNNFVYLGSSVTDYNIRLEASTKYIVSYYAMAASGTPNVRGYIKQDDAALKVFISQAITASWARYQFIVTTDANLTNSGLLLINNDTNGATVYFDAIQVEKASDATSPEAQPYTPSGTVEIYGGQIEANSITATQIAAGTITATQIKGTGFGTLTITSGKIVINVADALEIGGSGNINLLAGGDINLTASDTNPSLITWIGKHTLAASVSKQGLGFFPNAANTDYWGVGYDILNDTAKKYQYIYLYSYLQTVIGSYYGVNQYGEIEFYSDSNDGRVDIKARDGDTEYVLRWDGPGILLPLQAGRSLGSSTYKWHQGWFNDYIIAEGGIHVGGTSDPGTDNLLVDGKISSGTATITASADNTDVSGINTLFINPAAAVVIGAFIGGVNGQELRVVVIDDDQDVKLEHNKGTGNQNIFLHKGLDETIDSHYGGWNLVCDGSNWYDESHAKHV